MATKAELAAELALLRQKLADADPATRESPDDPAPPPKPDLNELLASHGFETQDFTHLLERLTRELEDLSHDKPLLTASVAFGLGFTLGRMSK